MQNITDLKRELSDSEKVICLYFTDFMVDAHNMSRLDLLENERVSFAATNTGDIRGVDCLAPKVSYFKAVAPVLVFYNINENSHNGTTGRSTSVPVVCGGDSIVLNFVPLVLKRYRNRFLTSRFNVAFKTCLL